MANPPQRIHFGSLENQLSVRNPASNNNVPPPAPPQEFLPFSDKVIEAQQKHQQTIDDYEARKKAKQLNLPTDDKLVKAKLRELGEPIILFGEQAPERRERLRELMARRGIEDGMPTKPLVAQQTVSSTEPDELFYTEGTPLLKVTRMFFAKYSLQKAQERIQRAKQFREALDNVDFLIEEDKRLSRIYSSFDGFSLVSSQVGEERPIGHVSILPDNKRVVTASWNGICKLWNIEDSKELMVFNGHTDRATSIVPHPQCSISQSTSSVNLASTGADSLVNLWSLESSKPIATLKGHTHRVNKVDFHPCGKYMASCSTDLTWKLWDIETGREIYEQEGHSRAIFGISFHPDGSLVATGGFDMVTRVWDLRSGKSIQVYRGHSKPILGLDWAQDGYRLMSCSEDNSCRIYDIRKKRQSYVIPAHTNNVVTAKFFHNDDLIFTGSFDNTIKFWSPLDYSPVKSILGNEGKILSVDVSSDFKYIITGNYDRTWKLFMKTDFTSGTSAMDVDAESNGTMQVEQ